MTVLRNKSKEIEIIVQSLPEMLFQRSRHNFNRSLLTQPFQQSDVRARKGTAYNTTFGIEKNHRLHPNDSKLNLMDYEQQNNKQEDICIDIEWSKTARDYCRGTTLHGLRYVGDNELHIVERLFWSGAFVLGVLAAAYFITILYRRWDDNPMIISLSPKPTLLDTIPFPAITICNMNGAKKSIAEEIANSMSSDPHTRFEKQMLKDICGQHGPELVTGREPVVANWTTIQNFYVKVSQPCHEMLLSCSWTSKSVPCNNIFNPELTDEGMCCSFNKVEKNFVYRNPRHAHVLNYTFPYQGIDWTPEKGYPPNTPPLTNPWRAFGAGKEMGLSIVLDAELSDYYCSSTASVGFKMLMHNPIETPKISDFAYLLTPGRETRIEIIPRISSSTPDLVNIPENKRKCIFPSDRELRFYRTYTERNCELECQSNFTLNRCGCVPFYLPKDLTTRICGTGDDACILAAKEAMEFKLRNNGTEMEDLDCACLPSCVQVRYSKQMSTSKLEDIFTVRSEYLVGRSSEYYKKNMVVVHFFFVETSFTGFEKGEIFGFTDFLSSTGGLLGLFLGFSFMSAAEVVYYTTLRLFCIWNRKRKQKMKQFPSQINAYPFAQ